MKLADGLALYAAALSSALAILQVVLWRQGRKFVSVRYIESFDENDNSTFEVTLTNRGNAAVHLDYVACGWSARYFRRPWRREAFTLVGVAKFDRSAGPNGGLHGTADGTVLKPGDLLLVGFLKSTVLALLSDPPKRAFSVRPVVFVEHSQSDRDLLKVVSFSK